MLGATTDRSGALPFLKWAGGKRWLIQNEQVEFPRNFNRYVEPFLGSGVVFFHLCPRRALLSDANPDLIATYRAVKIDWRKVQRSLCRHQGLHDTKRYYRVRESVPSNPFSAAARFIYLNRTCWNGLYRVNHQGMFNVPIGTRNSVVFEDDDFGRIAAVLRGATLKHCDFEMAIDAAKSGDLVFADPPYTVKHNHNGFVRYNETIFSWADQQRLATALIRALHRGVSVVATNANHPSVRALYRSDFRLRTLSRNSSIAAVGAHRGSVTELLITGT